MSIVYKGALRQYDEFFAYKQTITTTMTAGNGQAGRNPQVIANTGGRWGVIISASEDSSITIPAGGTISIQIADTHGNISTMVHTNESGAEEVYSDTEKVLEMNASNEFTYKGGPVTLSFMGAGGTTGTFDASPYYNAS